MLVVSVNLSKFLIFVWFKKDKKKKANFFSNLEVIIEIINETIGNITKIADIIIKMARIVSSLTTLIAAKRVMLIRIRVS